jgi:hypothetical protein
MFDGLRKVIGVDKEGWSLLLNKLAALQLK